ncbi:MAG: TIGR04013 family B12-binding domain/radical SAM domain-containing protein [Candidatus Kariarchaeaceae archaeon]
MITRKIKRACLIFPFSKVNANAISALIASLDVHPVLQNLSITLPKLNSNPKSVIEKIKATRPIILAFSVFSTQFKQIKRLVKEYRAALGHRRFIIITGGPHPIGNPRSMLLNGSDIVCTGEGELVFSEIILKFIQEEELKGVSGIAYLNDDNKVVRTKKPNPVNLNEFPPFSVKHQLYRPIEITRGCAWKCRFCQVRSKGSPVRHRSLEEVFKYVELTKTHFSERRTDIRFISPNALSYGSIDGKTVNLNQIELLLSGIRKIIGPDGKIYFGSFPSEIRPETISNESVEILKRYTNVTKIILGGQSGSDRVLSFSTRGHDSAETERAVELLRSAGFEVNVDMIFGLPGEEDQDVQSSIKHMDKLLNLGATIHSHTFMPLVGTPFASEDPGIIHLDYVTYITDINRSRKISGLHHKQEKQAREMAERRKEERD